MQEPSVYMYSLWAIPTLLTTKSMLWYKEICSTKLVQYLMQLTFVWSLHSCLVFHTHCQHDPPGLLYRRPCLAFHAVQTSKARVCVKLLQLSNNLVIEGILLCDAGFNNCFHMLYHKWFFLESLILLFISFYSLMAYYCYFGSFLSNCGCFQLRNRFVMPGFTDILMVNITF